MNPVRYPDLAAVLARLGYAESAAHYHGALCGVLCRVASEEVDPVRLLGQDVRSPYDAASRRLLAWTRDQAVDALADEEESFRPLLPLCDAPLAERAKALAQWCDGFLFGLSSERELKMENCSDEVREALSDFTEFTSAAFQASDDLDSEEEAYAQIVEYLCVTTRLLYWQLHPRTLSSPPTPSPSRLH